MDARNTHAGNADIINRVNAGIEETGLFKDEPFSYKKVTHIL